MTYSVSYPVRRVFINQVEVVESLPPFVFSYSIIDNFYQGNPEYKELILYITMSGFVSGTHSFTVSVYHQSTTSQYSQSIIYRLYTYRPTYSEFVLSGSIPAGTYSTEGVPPFFVFSRIGWKNEFYDPISIEKIDFLPMTYDLIVSPVHDTVDPTTLYSFSYYVSFNTQLRNEKYFRGYLTDPIGLNLEAFQTGKIYTLFRTLSGFVNAPVEQNTDLIALRTNNYGLDYVSFHFNRTLYFNRLTKSLVNATLQHLIENYLFFFASHSMDTISFVGTFENRRFTHLYTYSQISISYITFPNEIFKGIIELTGSELNYFTFPYIRTIIPYIFTGSELDYITFPYIRTTIPYVFTASEIQYAVLQERILDKIYNFSGSLEYPVRYYLRYIGLGTYTKTHDSIYSNFAQNRIFFSHKVDGISLSVITIPEHQQFRLVSYSTIEMNHISEFNYRRTIIASMSLVEIEHQPVIEEEEFETFVSGGSIWELTTSHFNRRINIITGNYTLSGAGALLIEDGWFEINITLTKPEFIIY